MVILTAIALMVVGTPGNFHFFKTRSEEQFDYDVMQLGAGFDLI